MLVLSRKTSEKFCVGEHIYVTVLQVQGGEVRLGIQAPREVVILRQELVRRRDEPGPTEK